MAKFCTSCGQELAEGVKFCENCGSPVDVDNSSSKETISPASSDNQSTSTSYTVNNNSNQTNSFAVAGFVVSLISTLLCCGAFNLISLILSIVGLVQAKNYNGAGKGMAIAGIIISCLTAIISLILFFVVGIGGVIGATSSI